MTYQKRLTSIGDQQWLYVCLVFGKHFSELRKAGDTPATEQLQQSVVAITHRPCVNKLVSLTQSDATDCRTSKLSDEGIAGVDEFDQMNTVH